jgi:hypothetical protein
MARKPSVILTPAEKKQAVTGTKEAIKASRIKLSTLTKERKLLDKEYTAATKANLKEEAAVKKDLIKLELELNNLVPPRAVATSTAV